MLSRSHRVSTKEFESILKGGRVIHSPLFTVRYTEHSGSEQPSKIAAVAPSKIAKTAAIRNRTRRRIYSAVQSLTERLISNRTILIFAKQPSLEMSSKELEPKILELFVKAGLLR